MSVCAAFFFAHSSVVEFLSSEVSRDDEGDARDEEAARAGGCAIAHVRDRRPRRDLRR